MLRFSMPIQLTCTVLFSFAPAAYAQQQSDMSNMSGMSGSKMQGMHGNATGGMNMQTMMKHCAQMHQQMSQGKTMTPDMHKMMKQCDQMDSSMKAPTQAPAATQDR